VEDVFGASFCVQKNTRLSLWAVRERERVKSEEWRVERVILEDRKRD
jgi:hypothetical protein